MARHIPASVSQRRAGAVLGIALAPDATYPTACAALAAVGAPPAGTPGGMGWRDAAQLTDAELRRLLGEYQPFTPEGIDGRSAAENY